MAFASLFPLSYGVVKVALVFGMWMNKLSTYPLTIAVFAAFCADQSYRYTHSVWMLILTIFDLVLIYLTWEQNKQQKKLRRANSGPEIF